MGAGGALGAAGAKVQDGFAPVAHALVSKCGHGVNLEALSAPAEGAIRRRVAATDDVDPEGLLGRRFQQIDLKVQVVLLGKLLHPGERAFHHFHNGRYFDAGVGAEDCDGLFPLVVRDAGDDFNDEGRQHGAVFAAAEADEPGAGVVQVELAERTLDVLVTGGVHR